MKNTQALNDVIYTELTLEELIIITNALGAVSFVDFDKGINSDKIYTTSYCRNPLLKNSARRKEIYTDMMRELERRGVIEPSWAAKFD
ncbi:hypothetical protein [Listeria newyorkensis]|uniref:Uncharacterized protein n=1 Tax=Listeria newyorkensis TaxID=1497681 RepID=A0A841YS93_9LIST|nr:hypothetical protein [Listeria newyorkensis]MBC1456260.1 hypothetical protein [Listeria newyorkensis]